MVKEKGAVRKSTNFQAISIVRLSPAQCLSLYGTLGFCSMIVQALLIREFMVVVYGTELSLGLLFASWLLWIAIGAEVGSWWAPRMRRPALAFACSLIVVACMLPVQVTLIRAMHFILRTPVGEFPSPLPMAMFILIALAPFSLAVGFTFPLGVRLWQEVSDVAARPVAWIYMVEAVGSMLGGMAFTLILVPRLHTFWCITLTVALLCSATAMLMWILLKQKRLQCIIGIGIAMLPALLMVTNVNRLEGATVQMRWRSFGTGNELLKSIDSPYQNIAIGKRLEQYSVFCNGHFTLNFPDPYMNATLAKLLVSEADKPRSALIIGGGIEGLLTQLHLADVKTIHYVQIDPWLVRAIISFLPPSERMVLKRAGIKLFYTDARQFVYSTRERYDLIFLHLGDPSTALLNRYYTLEFFKLVREHLTDRGIFALHITASESYFGPGVAEYVASIYHTLKRAFPNIAIAVGETTYFFATRHRGLVSESPEELMRRVQWLGQSRTQDDSGAQLDSHTMRNSSIMDEFSVRTIPPEVLYAFFPPLRADWMREQLMLIRKRIGEERANRILLNTDLQPVSYFHYLRLWLHRSHPQFMMRLERQLMSRIVRLCFIAISLVMLLALIADALLAQVHHKRSVFPSATMKRAALFGASCAGMAAMGLEVVLLLVFQSLYGALYQMVGLLIAGFMLGLALGSTAVGYFQRRRWTHIQAGIVLVGVLTGVAIFAFVLPLALAIIAHMLEGHLTALAVAFLILLGISGVLTGAVLPAAVAAHYAAVQVTGDEALSYAAGKVDRADHFGACIGAIAIAVLLLPLLGMKLTCITVGIINLIGAGYVALSYFGKQR